MSKFAQVSVPVPFYPWDSLFTYEVESENTRPGQLVEVSFGRRKLRGIVWELLNEKPNPDIKIKKISKTCLETPVFSEKKMAFLYKLASHYRHPLGLVWEAALPSAVRNGTDRTLKHEIPAEFLKPNIVESLHTLNEEQKSAWEKVMAEPQGRHLLWGITGSGKTEVYLKCVESCLEAGTNALILVPEIALTPLLTQRFQQRFPEQVAVFHSGQTPKKLREEWFKVWTGQAKIAIGARSALFAPFSDLKLIVVDEEHDSSYKQEEGFRYHAVDAAELLADQFGATLLLGSATPRGESLYRVEQGNFQLHRLSARAQSGAVLPRIEIIDLKKQLAQENKVPHVELSDSDPERPRIEGDFFLSPALHDALEETLKSKEQAILFINRRGVGSQFVCKNCGHTPDCPNCDVKLTPHSKTLLCHYCGYKDDVPAECSSCGEKDKPFHRVGMGTEGIEEALSFHFPEARVARLDRDTAQNSKELEKIIAQFTAHEADILIGTQMVAKGHDFPNVSLVGIMMADMGLSIPDFRANERALQLLQQVAGRAGRAQKEGRVFLQTFQPEHPVLECLRKADPAKAYENFLHEELLKRKELLYAPFAQMALVRLDSLDAVKVQEAARYITGALVRLASPKFQILGPSPSPLSRLRGRYRHQILLKSLDSDSLGKSLDWLLQGWHKGGLEKRFRTRLLIDVDPQGMM